VEPLTKSRERFALRAVVWLSLSGLLAAAAPQSLTGGVSGPIRLIVNDHTVPLVDARVTISNASNDRDEHESVTDKAGQYAIDLPAGTYKMHFFWRDGDCSTVRRAPFSLGSGEHLTFDFVIMPCPFADAKPEVPYEKGHGDGFESMNVPFDRQGHRYVEQLIPARPDHWPEIIVSFGKYDNRVDEIRYFPMHQAAQKDAPATTVPLPLSLPVTVTVDRYTLQAMEVALNKKTMVFTAKSVVFISDGKSGRMGNSATLSFSSGRPVLKMEH